MKLPFFKRRPPLPDAHVVQAMDDLRKLRLEVWASQVEAELRRFGPKVRVLRFKSVRAEKK